MTIKFHSEARKEFFEQLSITMNKFLALGDDFIDEVEKVLGVIEQHPSSGT